MTIIFNHNDLLNTIRLNSITKKKEKLIIDF